MIAALLGAALGCAAQKVVTPQEAGDAYTITTTLKLAQPYDVRAMNDEFQSARLLEEKDGAGTFEITYRPFHVQTVTANPNWRTDDAKMDEFLRRRPAANWNPDLRAQILADLKADDIDPSQLDDKTLVERLAGWAIKRSRFNDQFGLWMVQFGHGKAEVPANLRASFTDNEPKGMSDEEIFNREVFGDGMYRNRTHGSCTSTSTYMATILRAVGIPTRIILTVPAADGNDPEQVKMLLAAIRRDQTRHTVKMGLPHGGFSNHVYNEVWIGGKWIRLNYNRLAQPILDQSYMGLMTHVYTANDVSEVPFPTTWGARYALHEGPKLSSENPYQLLAAKDDLQSGLVLDNPPVETLTSVTVIAAVKPSDPRVANYKLNGVDGLLQIKEWIQGQNYTQLREFLDGAGKEVTLRGDGQPEIKGRITGSVNDGAGGFQAFVVHLDSVPAAGVKYRIALANQGHEHTWKIQQGVFWQG